MPFLDYSQISYPINTRDNNEIRINCVYCQDERYHCYINLKKGVFHCFRCGASGKTNVNTESSKQLFLTEVSENDKFDYPKVFKLPEASKPRFTVTAVRYLSRRGILETDTDRHGIYCASPKTILFGRVIIPTGFQGDRCKYYAARSYLKLGFPKYLNPPGSKENPFESPPEPDPYQKQFWPVNELMLVEGPFDYLKASRHGPTIALLGKELSNKLARYIVSKYNKVYVMLDQGLKEHWAAIKIQDLLKVHVETEVLTCPRNDPGEMNEADFRDLFE